MSRTVAASDRTHMPKSLYELEQVADAGESDKTPLVLIGEVWVVVTIALLLFLALALLA